MTNRIVIFYGSKKDFEKLVARETYERSNYHTLYGIDPALQCSSCVQMNLVCESLRVSRNIDVDNCVVRADDYGSVLEHVLSNFVNVVTLNHDIGTLFVHNPPRKVRDSLRSPMATPLSTLVQNIQHCLENGLKKFM